MKKDTKDIEVSPAGLGMTLESGGAPTVSRGLARADQDSVKHLQEMLRRWSLDGWWP